MASAFWWFGVGAAITIWSFGTRNLVFALAAALATCAFIAAAVVAQIKAIEHRRAASRKSWPPELVTLQQHALDSLEAFKHTFLEVLPRWERASQEQPYDPTAWAGLAFALNLHGRYEEALAASERALLLDPQHAAAWARKGGALANLGRDDEALTACDYALALDPRDPSAWLTKARMLRRRGRMHEAMSVYACMPPLVPDSTYAVQDTYAWYAKAGDLHQLGKYAEAVAACDQLLALYPDFIACLLLKAVCLHALGRKAEGEAALRRAQSLAQ